MSNANYFIIFFLGVKIRTKLMDILQNIGWDLDEDQPVIVTDRGSNIIAAFQGYDHIHLVNHLFQKIIKATDYRIF